MRDETSTVEIEVPSPLRECFLHCEVFCMRACCGIDAISSEPELVASWGRAVGRQDVAQALRQVDQLIDQVAERSHKVSSLFLNHDTADEGAREELLSFLEAFKVALEAA